ncbi:S41 family peptidase [Pedobacter psychrodurus]|uniref:S41 family peptidase n=1 Tax=Pedobacter psychrodurus TaxID=2530456 RepID=UPI00292D079B|nr:S41 family peptidase [Pedobacter psychrodurus]
MKKILIILLLLIVLKAGATVKIESSDSIKTYIEKALRIIKNRSVNSDKINSDKINWDKIELEATEQAAKFKNIRETYPIIKDVLEKLGDSHSKFFTPEVVESYVKGYRASGLPFPEIQTAFLENRYAYIALPAFYSYNMNEWNEFVNHFRAELLKLSAQKPKGWILDLRDNEGGMFAPMYAAIAPLLDQSNVIGWMDRSGKNNFFNFKDDRLFENKKAVYLFKLTTDKIKIKNLNLAVLVNEKTASSAEFAAISFVGQKNATIIGNKTNGLTSANQEHKLSDGAFLVLTEGITIDRNLNQYAEIGVGLVGDVKVGRLSGDEGKDKQLYLEKAYEVLNKKTVR